jgi:pimeloyl-ACP methyl ester carboxylesterase
MDRWGVRSATLVGNSAGGTIAVLTALHFPERVSSLILVSPAIYESGGVPSWVRTVAALPQVRRVSPLLVRFLVGRLERSLPTAWHDPSKVGPDVLEGYKKPLQAENWDRAFWEFTLAGRALDLDKQLDRITQPTLVIAGDDDRWVPTAQSVRLSQELRNADLAVLPNCGHVPQEECPAEFLQAVSSFLQPR